MKNIKLAALASAALFAAAAPASATIINFDDGTAGMAVGNFYAAKGVTFSNTSFASNFGLTGSSGALGINSSSGGYAFGASQAIAGSFASAVSNISIRAIDIGNAGGRLEAYNSLGALVASDEFFGSDVGIGAFHDFSVAASGITSFKIYQPNSGTGDGVVFDNFSFSAAAVPEPATWAMMILGMGAVGFAMRRRNKNVSTTVRFA